ncbi:bifunctional diaminohydroxyphosphoribosylaminopyrimidine deaminase/5-amino-6-(5-phosphoribosylamino)uracil reductase RibD [Salinisphaera sp. USBA-960]|nr:bifunctional diaminohydroxyphosphoribosylaminopyrimidine deaminase/5-amino-6-(5-phosphoribosylamino)uracil reductase RibD [Salifodinibacter halophilus]NNC25325.1 bifunctional diaminohydroxyphosphoribosylaminopyrimidine deaminase/5-amino-6-(5-phosphoribosylamino)uracil reductase RibD [Salifodinibacter halophilus]
MGYAVELANQGWYSSPPNPRVGCVLVRKNRVIGEGWHAVTGHDHAERAALADARNRGASTQGATAYVTLEPCSIQGRTPACTDALIEARVSRVVVGALDPNPAVHGGGLQALEDAGVETVAGVDDVACRALNPGFEQRMRTGRPRVRIKLALTLDGRTAAVNGESQWLTGRTARADGHRLRAESGAVLVGRGTQVADDPTLSVRLPGDGWRQPHPVVVDRDLLVKSDARLLDPERIPIIFTATDDVARVAELERAGAHVHRVAHQADGVDLDAMLRALATDYAINDVLVEAGPTLSGALAEAGLVDGYVFYMAPKLLGSAARGALDLPGVGGLAAAHDLVIERVDPVGSDWRITASPQ